MQKIINEGSNLQNLVSQRNTDSLVNAIDMSHRQNMDDYPEFYYG